MRPIVLDKNYLQGARAELVSELARSHRLLMPDALFYEMISDRDTSRWKIFAKLPEVDNPVGLLEGVGEMLRHELERAEPFGLPSARTLPVDFRFHPGLRDPAFALPQFVLEENAREAEFLEGLAASFLTLIATVPTLFPLLDKPRNALTPAEIEDCMHQAASIDFGVAMAREVTSPDSDEPLFADSLPLDGRWILVRRYQVMALFAIDYYVRLGPLDFAKMTPNQRLKLEHDLHDMDILILGVAEGALATHERKLRRWFRLLAPEGLLLPPDPPGPTAPPIPR